MTIAQAAEAAVPLWDRDNAIVMVAIAGGESGYNPGAGGDHIDFLACFYWEGIYGPGTCTGPLYDAYRLGLWEDLGPYACDGFTSIGLWQIHMPAHRNLLFVLTASEDACDWRGYLVDAAHNAAVARQVWDSQGFGAWSVYNLRLHEAFLEEATVAVDEAIAAEAPPEVPEPPPLPPPSLPTPPIDFRRLTPVVPPWPSSSEFLSLAPVEPPR